MNVDFLGGSARLVTLEGENNEMLSILTKRDYDAFMGKDYFTKSDIDYLETYYPEYLGAWGTIIAAAGKGLKGIGKGISRAVKKRKSKKKKAAAAKKEKARQQEQSRQIAAIQQQNFLVDKKKKENLIMVLIVTAGVGTILYMRK